MIEHNDLNVGYQAGQRDSKAVELLRELVCAVKSERDPKVLHFAEFDPVFGALRKADAFLSSLTPQPQGRPRPIE
jgi:hypothetical protein